MAKEKLNKKKNKKGAEGDGLAPPKHTSVGTINNKTFAAKVGMNKDERLMNADNLTHTVAAQKSPMKVNKDNRPAADKPPEPVKRKAEGTLAEGTPDAKGSKDVHPEFCLMPEKHPEEPPLMQPENTPDSFYADAKWVAKDDPNFLDDAEHEGATLEEADQDPTSPPAEGTTDDPIINVPVLHRKTPKKRRGSSRGSRASRGRRRG